jgi:hypothetical protein
MTERKGCQWPHNMIQTALQIFLNICLSIEFTDSEAFSGNVISNYFVKQKLASFSVRRTVDQTAIMIVHPKFLREYYGAVVV